MFEKRITLFLFFVFFWQTLFATKLPEIEPSDVNKTLHQIMEAHVSYKCLTPNLVKRSLSHFLEILDPTKTYFLQSEIAEWEDPSEACLGSLLTAIEQSDFTAFKIIYEKMIAAIERRNQLEQKIEHENLPSDVSVNEFKNLSWTENEATLKERLIRIKSLQTATAEKLDKESKEKILQRIQKRRVSKEEEICSDNPQERERYFLSCVIKSLASSFDNHTSYFTPGEAAQFLIQVQQRLFGIGAQLKDDLNGFTIVKIIEGSPASRNTGLKVNDRIIAINKEPVVGLEITDAVELIRGEEGTKVCLTILRPIDQEREEKLDIEITRGEVIIKEARIETSIIPFGDGVIAHIALHAFYQDPLHSSSGDLYEEIAKLKKTYKMKGIILDLRHNSGGVLPQAVSVTGLFITKGIVVSIKDNRGLIEHLREIDGKTAWDGPLIVLTSKASASAAEIVAQTLQDYGRAIIVGDAHTYGKGTFQTFTLDASGQGKVNPKGEFKVTRGKYYTVSGKSPQLKGVEPHILVPGFFSELDIGERYADYALENDFISENFHDDLSDIPVVQRDQISWLYRFNLQSQIKSFTQHLPMLIENSSQRLSEDKLYQNFLQELKNDDLDSDRWPLFILADLQLKETTNIMKDLIILSN